MTLAIADNQTRSRKPAKRPTAAPAARTAQTGDRAVLYGVSWDTYDPAACRVRPEASCERVAADSGEEATAAA